MQLADQAEQLLRAGDNAGALAALEKASAESSSAPGEDRIGFLYAVAGHQDDAASHFRKAIAADSTYAPAHYHLGVVLWLQKDQDHALPELQLAVKLDPKTLDFQLPPRFRLRRTRPIRASRRRAEGRRRNRWRQG